MTPAEIMEVLEHAREKMWEYGFSEDDLQPVRQAIASLSEARPAAGDVGELVARIQTIATWLDDFGGRTSTGYATTSREAATALTSQAARIAEMDAALTEARIWHEAQDKAISKQPNANAGHNGWMRCQHQEQIAAIDAALTTGGSNG